MMKLFNYDTKSATTALKVLIIAVTLLSFSGDAIGQTVLRLKKYKLKTRNMAVEEMARTDSTVMYSWNTLIANWDSTTVRFNVKVILKDSIGLDVYRHTSEEKYKLEAGEGMLADGTMTLPIASAHLISNFGFEFDYTPQWGYEASLILFEALKAGRDKNMAEAKRKVAPQQVSAKPPTEQPKWVQPKIYPGVKLYYSHDGMKMRYIGTIFDAVSRTIDGERCFGITMASGSKEYKQRAILWNGYWFMDQVQGQKAIDKFMEQ